MADKPNEPDKPDKTNEADEPNMPNKPDKPDKPINRICFSTSQSLTSSPSKACLSPFKSCSFVLSKLTFCAIKGKLLQAAL